jgi:beta-lactam-binding protein with PASTA domain
VTGEAARAPARPKRRPWLARQDWYFAVALAAFVGTSVWFGRSIQDFFAPSAKTVAAPTLLGETLGDAITTSSRMHLRAVVIQHSPSDRFPRDVVMRQDPPPGAQVREGRQISLVVSTGVQIFPMPDLRYESMREVGLDLSHFKLALGKVKIVPSDEVPANHVVTQDPPPLSSVRVGSTVNVEVAKGGPPAIHVPNFVDMDVDEARQAASDAHIHIGQLVWTPFGRWGPPRGVVVRQSPGSDALIDPSQTVSLQISAGPRESGYLIRQVHATATVPENIADPDADAGSTSSPNATPLVRVQVRDETGTWNVFDGYAQPKQKLDFNLTVVGTAHLDIFVNEELLDSTSLGVEPSFQEKQQMGPLPPGSKPASNSGESPSPAPQPSTPGVH